MKINFRKIVFYLFNFRKIRRLNSQRKHIKTLTVEGKFGINPYTLQEIKDCWLRLYKREVWPDDKAKYLDYFLLSMNLSTEEIIRMDYKEKLTYLHLFT